MSYLEVRINKFYKNSYKNSIYFALVNTPILMDRMDKRQIDLMDWKIQKNLLSTINKYYPCMKKQATS